MEDVCDVVIVILICKNYDRRHKKVYSKNKSATVVVLLSESIGKVKHISYLIEAKRLCPKISIFFLNFIKG